MLPRRNASVDGNVYLWPFVITMCIQLVDPAIDLVLMRATLIGARLAFDGSAAHLRPSSTSCFYVLHGCHSCQPSGCRHFASGFLDRRTDAFLRCHSYRTYLHGRFCSPHLSWPFGTANACARVHNIRFCFCTRTFAMPCTMRVAVAHAFAYLTGVS